jgi:hypothetical protein
MKANTIQKTCLALLLGAAILVPALAQAGGNMGQKIATFEPVKSPADLDKLKEGDTVMKVCRACGAATFVRVDKSGKGVYDYVAKKCDECGSENTYLAVSKQVIPFKEQIKR